ncbi:MAG: PPK2 family polyphosphate kinase, partial [Pirellulales bacterium]
MPIDFAKIEKKFRVSPGKAFRLADHDPAWAGNGDIPESERKETAQNLLASDVAALAKMQELLWASDTWSVLVIFQAMDAAGKDGAIKHVMSGVNPQGVEVTSFKKPSDEELDHTFLWRCMKRVPERGRIGIFNRSYYEEVLVVRVHGEVLARQKLPANRVSRSIWKERFEDIRAYERYLDRNGVLVRKIFLNVSRAEQKRRFLERIDNPEKNWKFEAGDVRERGFWKEYT